jgi:multidrug efflux pump subunit AcrB
MKLAGMSFNMMTLGGIAASIGLLIDNAIIVVEAMCVKIAAAVRDSREFKKPSAKF